MRIPAAILTVLFSASALAAPVTITIGPTAGPFIPPTFSGLSYESAMVLPNDDGYTFWPGNLTLQGVYKTLGIKCIRVGGNTVDRVGTQTTQHDVDNLFAFAKAANLQIIYSLQLKNSAAAENVQMADYIYNKYRANLKCFTVGNEPNYYIKLDQYEKDYNDYEKAIIAKDPQAVFCGPDAGHKMESWAAQFADTYKGDPHLALVAHHAYQGGPKETGQAGRDFLLSPDRDAGYLVSFNTWGAVALKDGFGYRITETNSFNGGGAPDSSNTFASALWSLDYLYWWASHGADGINFHTPPSAYAVMVLSGEGYTVRPIGYGIAAFGLADNGKLSTITIDNPQKVNLTAYAVAAPDNTESLTIINKEHGKSAQDAAIMLNTASPIGHVEFMTLEATGGDGATTGITLGGSEIAKDGKWTGTWKPVTITDGQIHLTVPATTAMIVRIHPT